MKPTTRLLAALCSTLFMAGAAHAQGATGDNPAPSGDRSVDCLKDTYSASGTGSSRPLAKSNRSVNRSYLATHGNIPGVYAQCTSNKDRSARAECIRNAYESRMSATTASNSMRKPC